MCPAQGLDADATLSYSADVPQSCHYESARAVKCRPLLAMGVFPLWTCSGAFGVISIFTGPEKKLYIENDKIPIGATAYFKNEPNLAIVEYKT